MKDWVDILLVSRRHNVLRRIRMPAVLVIACGLVFALMTFGTFALTLYNQTLGMDRVKRLTEEHVSITRKLDSLSTCLVKMDNSFGSSIDEDNRERSFWQMAYFHPDVWSMGIGGKTYQPDDENLSSKTESLLSSIYGSIDVLKGKCVLRSKSLSEIQTQISNYLNLWSHIPSTNPIPGQPICSDFGYRTDPIVKDIRMHTGVDISAPRGTAIYATADGNIIFAGWKSGLGLNIEIDHGFGFRTRYAHCQKILAQTGEHVQRGQLIATVGATGRAIAPHTHYEVSVSGEKVNPEKYIIRSDIIVD